MVRADTRHMSGGGFDEDDAWSDRTGCVVVMLVDRRRRHYGNRHADRPSALCAPRRRGVRSCRLKSPVFAPYTPVSAGLLCVERAHVLRKPVVRRGGAELS